MKKHLSNELPNEFTRYNLESMFVDQGGEGGGERGKKECKKNLIHTSSIISLFLVIKLMEIKVSPYWCQNGSFYDMNANLIINLYLTC
jgi:hypothetical protein